MELDFKEISYLVIINHLNHRNVIQSELWGWRLSNTLILELFNTLLIYWNWLPNSLNNWREYLTASANNIKSAFYQINIGLLLPIFFHWTTNGKTSSSGKFTGHLNWTVSPKMLVLNFGSMSSFTNTKIFNKNFYSVETKIFKKVSYQHCKG